MSPLRGIVLFLSDLCDRPTVSMAQAMSKQTFPANPSTCSPLRKAAFSMGLLKMDPREDSKILGYRAAEEVSGFGERRVALGPALLRRLFHSIRDCSETFFIRSRDGSCYIYNTARLGHNLIVKINDERPQNAYFVLHMKNGERQVHVKELDKCGAGQKVARIGLLDAGFESNRIHSIDVYISSVDNREKPR